jgi:hypothetical protein
MAGTANLIPAVEGEVRNPNGRGKGTLNMSTRIRRILGRNIDWDTISIANQESLKKRYGKYALADAMILVQASKALTGDTQAFNALREAGWGRMVNVDGEAKIDVVHIYKPDKLESLQMEQAAAQLRERALKAVEGELLDEVDSSSGAADIRSLDT